MKKKILCFIFAFIFMFPFTFMLSGCFGENPPSDPPTTEQGGNGNGDNSQGGNNNQGGNTEPAPLTVDAILTSVESVKRDNFSIVISAEYTEKGYEITDGIQGAGKTEGKSMPNIFAKVDGDNAYINSDGLTGYIINGLSYGVDSDGDVDVNYTNKKGGIQDTDTQILNIVNQFSNAEIFGAFVKATKIINKTGITVTESANEITVDLDLNLTTLLQKTQTNLKTNNKKTLATFINQLLADISGETVDIVAIVNEFKATYTDDSTIEDLLNFVSKKTDIPFLTILEKVDAITKLYEDIQNETYSYFKYNNDYKLDNGTVNGSIYYQTVDFYPELDRQGYSLDSIKTMKLSGFANTENTDKTTKDFIFDTIEECLTDEDITIDVLMQNYYGEGYEESVEQLNQITSLDIKLAQLNANFVFDKNYNFKTITLTGTAEANSIDEKTKDGMGVKYTASTTVNFANHGNTVVAIPSSSRVDYVNIDIYLTTEDISKLVNSSNYMLVLNSFAVNIDNFSLQGYKLIPGTSNYETNPVSIFGYNSSTKLLYINKNVLLDAFSTPDINNLSLYMSNTENGYYIGYSVNVYVI